MTSIFAGPPVPFDLPIVFRAGVDFDMLLCFKDSDGNIINMAGSYAELVFGPVGINDVPPPDLNSAEGDPSANLVIIPGSTARPNVTAHYDDGLVSLFRFRAIGYKLLVTDSLGVPREWISSSATIGT